MKRSLMSKTILAVLALVMVLSLLPMAAMAAPVTHEIDASTLEAFEKADGQIGTSKALDDYFTLYLGEKTRVDGSNKTFDDGFVGSQRINFQGKTMFNDDGVQNCLQFTAEGAGKVKIWMVGGDAERYVTLFDAAGEVVSQDTGAIEKNAMYIKELEIPAAGTYYLGNTSGSNYFFKVEVTVEVVEEEPVKENKVLDFGDKSFTTDKWVYNQAITAAEACKLQMVIYDKSFDGTV